MLGIMTFPWHDKSYNDEIYSQIGPLFGNLIIVVSTSSEGNDTFMLWWWEVAGKT